MISSRQNIINKQEAIDYEAVGFVDATYETIYINNLLHLEMQSNQFSFPA